MGTKPRLPDVVALFVLAQSAVNAAGAEQYAFSAEDASVEHPVSVPPAVNRILAHEPDVKRVLEH